MHLVFDIDNTILVTTDKALVDNRYLVFAPFNNYVSMLRPGIKEFLSLCSIRGHDVSLWTRGTDEYARVIAMYLRTIIRGLEFKYVLSRGDCVIMGPDNVIKKPLSKIGGDVIFDDNYENYVSGDNFITVPYFDTSCINDDFFVNLTNRLSMIEIWSINDISS